MKWIARLLLAGLVLALISFFAAPGVAFFAIRSAADARDTAGLAGLVDYGQLRQSLRPQLAGNPAAVAPAPSFLEDPVEAVRRRLEPRPTVRPPEVDLYLTPAALAALTRGEGRAARSRTGAELAGRRDPWPWPAYWGVNRTRFAINGGDGARTLFTFQRTGLFEWRLVHIGLPDRIAPAAIPPTKR